MMLQAVFLMIPNHFCDSVRRPQIPEKIWKSRLERRGDCYGAWGGSATNCTVIDLDGNGYETIIIGTQEWLKQNLKVTKYQNGDAIDNVTSSMTDSEWMNLSTGAYNGDCEVDIYGRLYNGYVVTDSREVCPDGWHIPSDPEWEVLTNYLGGSDVAGDKMKVSGEEYWGSYSNSTNESGFTAIGAGALGNGGISNSCPELPSNNAYFWSSTIINGDRLNDRVLQYESSAVGQDLTHGLQRYSGYSIRCLKD